MFPLVYKLFELALLLPMLIASDGRTFFPMYTIKRELRNKIEDDWLNDLMVYDIKKEVFKFINDEIIIR